MASVIALPVISGWTPSLAENGMDEIQPVFVATINGLVIPSNSARGVAKAALESGVSLLDMMNGIVFSGGELDAVIAGALDFGLSSEAIVSMLLENGYPAGQVSGALASIAGPLPEAVVIERQTPLSGMTTVGFAEKSNEYIENKEGARSGFDRIMVGTSGNPMTDVVRNLLEQGFDIRDVVRDTSKRGVNFREVVVGAKAAGYSREMIARGGIGAGLDEEEVLLALRKAGLLGSDYSLAIERAAGFSAPVPLQGGIGGHERALLAGAAAP